MMSREFKAAYFQLMFFPMRINSFRHRLLSKPASVMKVQLGPGQKNYLDGWLNVDANFVTAKADIWADISAKLPFRNETVDAFYSLNVIEHLADKVISQHMADLFRCLKRGGIIRTGGPNGDMAIKKFQENDLGWFSDFPDYRRSIGGRFANFILCRNEHLAILTSSYLAEVASAAGFTDISFCRPGETNYANLIDREVLALEEESTPEEPHVVIIEARKSG
jgi:hypothetical protein